MKDHILLLFLTLFISLSFSQTNIGDLQLVNEEEI